jgi:hypothetical protein
MREAEMRKKEAQQQEDVKQKVSSIALLRPSKFMSMECPTDMRIDSTSTFLEHSIDLY